MTEEGEYAADRVVSDLDAGQAGALAGPRKRACEGEAVLLRGGRLRDASAKSCRQGSRTHSVVLPSEPGALYASLEAGEEPRETMAFLNYYRGGEIYPNEGGTLAVLLTAPANGREYGLEDPFVGREIERVSGCGRASRTGDRDISGSTRSSTPRTSAPGGARAGRYTVPCVRSGGADRCTGPRTTIVDVRGCGGSGLRCIPGAAYRPFSGGP